MEIEIKNKDLIYKILCTIDNINYCKEVPSVRDAVNSIVEKGCIQIEIPKQPRMVAFLLPRSDNNENEN